jgi:hypothetical protein
MSDDAFSDVKHYETALGGIFEDSEGLGALHKAKTGFQQTGRGLFVEFTCLHCGMPGGIEADWEELTYISMKREPPGWKHDRQHGIMRPHLGCQRCAMVVPVGLTPQECERALHGGIEAGYISREQVQRAVAHIQSKPGPQV